MKFAIEKLKYTNQECYMSHMVFLQLDFHRLLEKFWDPIKSYLYKESEKKISTFTQNPKTNSKKFNRKNKEG